MTRSALLLGFCLLAPALLAYAPHPSVLTVRYNGQMLPVVRVSGTEPYVMVEGKEKLVRSDPVYLVDEADGFSDNFVSSPKGALGGILRREMLGDHASSYNPSTAYTGGIYFEVPLTAKKTIKGGYVAMVFYTSDIFAYHPTYFSPAETMVHELPELPAGKTVKVKLSARALPRSVEPLFFAQIFDETGREVLTSGIDHAWQFYALRDRARFSRALEKYLEKFKGADHDAVPAITPKPIFDRIAVLPTGEVVVTLTVEPDGTISAVDTGNVADDRVRDSLTNALGGWLFLPKLRAGQPVSTYVRVPLQF